MDINATNSAFSKTVSVLSSQPHTMMSNSHFPAEVIEDTLRGNAIDYTANRLCLYHQATFDMRHKVFMPLQQMPEIANVHFGELSELDETFVLDCYKGKLLGDDGSSPENPVNMGKSKKTWYF